MLINSLFTTAVSALSISPTSGNIRFQSPEDSAPAVTQHVFSIPTSADTADYLVAIGTPENHHFHQVAVVMDYMHQYAAGLMPADTQLPAIEYVLPDVFGRSAFTELLLGGDMPSICESYGMTAHDVSTTIAEFAGLRIKRITMTDYVQITSPIPTPTPTGTIETPAEDDLDMLIGSAAGLAISRDLGMLKPAIVLQYVYTPPGVVRRLSDLEIAALLDVRAGRKLSANGSDRQRWPFNTMEVYDTVCIIHERAAKGQAAVHTYSQRTGRKFTTKRNLDKSLQVTRTF